MKTQIIKWLEAEIESTKVECGSHKLSESKDFVKGRLYTLRQVKRTVNKQDKDKILEEIYQQTCQILELFK